MRIIPEELKGKILMKTHKSLIQNIPFFKNQTHSFCIRIVDYLKPLNMGHLDLVYSQGDHANSIFFILSGHISMNCNMSDFIVSEELILKVQMYE